MTMGTTATIKCYDLCCGAGALSDGFRRAGGRVLGGVDVCPRAIASASRNHQGSRWDVTAIEDFAAQLTNGYRHPVLRADTLIAGLPCQGFSRAGKRDPADERNALYVHLLRVVKRVMPRHVVCENVVGFSENRNRRAFEALRGGLRRLGYDVSVRILDAADYGVPQHRKRVFLVAVLDGRADWVFECLRPQSPVPDVRAAFAGLSATREKSSISHVFMKHGKGVTAKLRYLRPGGPISYRRLVFGTPAPTLIAGHRALPVHPTQPRAISIREAARLQGFADSYVFEGSNSSQISQVANAVPPPLAMAIGRALRRYRSHGTRVRGALFRRLSCVSSPAIRRRLATTFLGVYRDKVRSFDWRKTTDPYRILITELLLQRTNAELAQTVWSAVLQLVPNPRAAKSVDLRTLGSLTRRIGIRTRARTIKALGTILQQRHHGQVPQAFDDLLRLPGVGLYIASAVRSLSFGMPDFPVDSNAIRFVSRYFGVALRSTKAESRQIREFMSALIPARAIRPYIYGFLDFAATVCRPVNPDCDNCPLKRNCKKFGVRPTAPLK